MSINPNCMAYQALITDSTNPRLVEARKIADAINKAGGSRIDSVVGLLGHKVLLLVPGSPGEITPALKTLRKTLRNTLKKKDK